MNIIKSVNYTKRDIVKAGVAVDTVQEHNGEMVILTGILFGSKYIEEDDKEVEVVVLKTSDDLYASNDPHRDCFQRYNGLHSQYTV